MILCRFILLALVAVTSVAYAGADRLSPLQEARLLYDQGMYPEAISKLETLVISEPQNPAAWALLGAAHRDNWNGKSALSALKKALRIDKQHQDARRYLGELYIMLGSMDKARKQLRKLARICQDCEQTFQLTLMIRNAESGYCRFIPKNRSTVSL